eukprot:1479041-Rhodomonas_salina.2
MGTEPYSSGAAAQHDAAPKMHVQPSPHGSSSQHGSAPTRRSGGGVAVEEEEGGRKEGAMQSDCALADAMQRIDTQRAVLGWSAAVREGRGRGRGRGGRGWDPCVRAQRGEEEPGGKEESRRAQERGREASGLAQVRLFCVYV